VRLRGLVSCLAMAGLEAFVVAGPVWVADAAASGARGDRDVSTLTAREAVLAKQADGARTAARWRLRALYRLAVAGADLPAAARARAIDAGARALARELAEARSLGSAREQLRAERDALAVVAREDEAIGASPVFTLPVAGAVLGRFGVAPDRDTGVLIARAGLRLAAAPRAAARAPAAGTVALVAADSEGTAVVLDAGAGWTTIVGGLAEAVVGEGERVAAGQRLGLARGPITFEVWRGRHPVDPLLLVRPSPLAREALAAPARLP
jgi:septal ring factor EnvC (AmiA/AmiB activator)